MPDTTLRIIGKDLSKQALASLRGELSQTISKFNEANKSGIQLADTNQKAKEGLGKYKEGLTALSIGLAAVSAATTLAVRSTINASIQFERINKSALAVSGGLLEASRQMARYREVAKLPGLGLEEVARGATSLQAVKMNAIDATNTIKVFGNALATVGKGRAELQGVILALTQMIGKGKVLAEEINQLAERVPQVRQVMVEAFGTADTEIIQTKVSAQEFIKILVDGLAKLPPVAGGIANSIENLRDSIQQLKVGLGNALLPVVISLLDKFAGLVESFNKLSPGMKALISWSAVLTAGITALGSAVLGAALAWDKLGASILALGARILPMLMNPVGLAIAGIAALGAGIFLFTKYLEASRYTAQRFADDMGEISQKLDRLKKIDDISDKIENLRKKTNRTAAENKELIDTQNELAQIAPELVKAFDSEGNAMIKAGKEVKAYEQQWKDLYDTMQQVKVARAEVEIDKLGKQIKDQTDLVNNYREAWEIARDTLGLMDSETKMRLDIYEQEAKKLDQLRGSLTEYNKTVNDYLEQFNLEGAYYSLGQPRPKPTAKPLTDDEIKLQRELMEAAANRIKDEYDKERELARVKAQIREEDLKKQFGKSRLLADALASNAKDLQAELARIDKEEAEAQEKLEKQIQDRRDEVIDKEIKAKEAQADRNRQIQEDEEKRNNDIAQRRDEVIDKEIKAKEAQADRNRRFNEAEQNQEDAIAKRRNEVIDKEIKRYEDIAERKLKRRESDARKQQELDEAQRKEILAIYDAYADGEKMRIELMADSTEKTLALLELEYKMRSHYIQLDLQDAEISAERKIYLAEQLYYIEQEYNQKQLELQNQTYLEIAQVLGDALSHIPEDIINIAQEQYDIAKDFNEKLKELEEDKSDQINAIRNDEFMSAAARAREIEKIEEESAKKRRKLEEDLQQAKKDAYTDYLKSFLAGIAKEIAAIYQKQAAEAIAKAIIAGITGLIAGPAAIPTMASISTTMLGFDNPSNDALARWYGARTALQGASFDEPVNDMRAKMMGTRVASYELGKRSADDMLQNFQQGFIQSASTLPGSSKEDYSAILSQIKDAVANPSPLIVMLDGKEIHSHIQRISDKTQKRNYGY